MITLRPYQQECIRSIPERGAYLIQLATGLGKTVIFTQMPRRGRMLIISHREELVRQPLKYFDCKTGVEMAGERAPADAEVVSASVQSLARRLDRYPDDYFDVVIIDECFPATATVDGKPLTSIKSGDIITSYNHARGSIEKRKVLHVFKRKPSALIRVWLKSGQSIVCTPNHPFWVEGKGYIAAQKLTEDDYVVHLHCLPEGGQPRNVHAEAVAKQDVTVPKNWAHLLLNGLLKTVYRSKLRKGNGGNEPKVCKRKNEGEQSHEEARDAAKGFGAVEGNRPLPESPVRKWRGIDRSSTKFVAGFKRFGALCGIPHSSENAFGGIELSDLLQGRCCHSVIHGSNRSRRKKPLRIVQKGARCKESGLVGKARVDSVEVLEPTSDGTFGGLCPDGFVYNLEVEGNHNYFVDGILVHNCHHAAASTYRKVIDHFTPRLLLGFTATPNRADKVRLDDVFEKIIFQRDLRWGVQNGWLSDIFCRRVTIGYDLSAVKTRGGDFAPGELDEALDGTEQAVADAYRQYAEGATLIFAASVRHAQAIAAAIGSDAVVVTGETKNRADIIRDFTSRKIKCLVNVMVFTEGTDIPLIETLIIARPTQSDSLYTQMVGRGLRLHPDKQRLNLIDCVGVTGSRHLCSAPSLLGISLDDIPAKQRERIQGDLFDLPDLAAEAADRPESWIRNVKIVDLWAKSNSYNLHDVAWFKMPDGSLRLSKPRMAITAPDELGNVLFDGREMPAQEAYDAAYRILTADNADSKQLWDKNAVKRWGSAPATEKQKNMIAARCGKKYPDIDVNSLTKGEAAMILNRVLAR